MSPKPHGSAKSQPCLPGTITEMASTAASRKLAIAVAGMTSSLLLHTIVTGS